MEVSCGSELGNISEFYHRMRKNFAQSIFNKIRRRGSDDTFDKTSQITRDTSICPLAYLGCPGAKDSFLFEADCSRDYKSCSKSVTDFLDQLKFPGYTPPSNLRKRLRLQEGEQK